MHRRHQLLNIPTEIVRTLVVISETGSFTKAGEKLALSQSAISAQIKKLQNLVGDAIFARVTGGVVFTERGTVVLSHARKLLEANDQIISLGGGARHASPWRVGLANAFVQEFFKNWNDRDFDGEVYFYCDRSDELTKALVDGYLHLACLYSPPPNEDYDLIGSWDEEYIWVRSQNFVLSPGAPIPVVCSPGSALDMPALAALERSNLAYRIVFTSTDYHARFDAVASGLGIMGIPQRQLREPLLHARDYYLPPLPPAKAGICLRNEIDRAAVAPILRALEAIRRSPS
jgi:DNA-binding transcriptional LysR family regulator